MAQQFTMYEPGQPFPGTVGRTVESSTEAWPSRPTAAAGAPNVLMVVLDDVGYGQLSTPGPGSTRRRHCAA